MYSEEGVVAEMAPVKFGRLAMFKVARKKYRREILEMKRRIPPILRRLCPNPINPQEDCFALTDELGRFPGGPQKKSSTGTTPEIGLFVFKKRYFPSDNCPQYLATKPQLFVQAQKAAEAIEFYKAAFGAELLNISKNYKRKAGQEGALIAVAEIKIGPSTFILSDLGDKSSSSTNTGLLSLVTDDFDGVVQKAVKAGADTGKIIRVYGTCCVWCDFIKLSDPYGNIWMVYNRLCSSCLQSFVLLA